MYYTEMTLVSDSDPSTKMNAKFISPFLIATSNVISTMAMLEIKQETANVKVNFHAQGAVTGFMNMESPQVRASLAISFEKSTILEICKRMLGEDIVTIDETVTDLVGEVTNMVTGGAKQKLEEQGFDFSMDRPSVVLGQTLLDHVSGGRLISIPFNSEAGRFYVEVCFA
jgi:chemotaxis protein CheX